jgi:hypothetical protein
MTSFSASSLNGLMTASIFFIGFVPLQLLMSLDNATCDLKIVLSASQVPFEKTFNNPLILKDFFAS